MRTKNTSTLIESRTRTGQYDEYELTESLYQDQDGKYTMNRDFVGLYDITNKVRSNWVINHQDEPLSEDQAKAWLNKEASSNMFNCPTIKTESCKDEEAVHSWFRPLIESTIDNLSVVEIEMGCAIYDPELRAWETACDMISYGPLISEKNLSVDEWVKKIDSYLDSFHIQFQSPLHTEHVDILRALDEDLNELGRVENNNLYEAYSTIGRDINGYDMFS